MTKSLHRLLYHSRSRVPAVPAIATDAIRSILLVARRNNPRVGVSGALLFRAGCFGQVLEGPREGVEVVFARIKRDERHEAVTALSFQPVASRAFSSWSMAFPDTDRDQHAGQAAFAADTDCDPSRMSADALFETLHRLVLLEHAVAI